MSWQSHVTVWEPIYKDFQINHYEFYSKKIKFLNRKLKMSWSPFSLKTELTAHLILLLSRNTRALE